MGAWQVCSAQGWLASVLCLPVQVTCRTSQALLLIISWHQLFVLPLSPGGFNSVDRSYLQYTHGNLSINSKIAIDHNHGLRFRKETLSVPCEKLIQKLTSHIWFNQSWIGLLNVQFCWLIFPQNPLLMSLEEIKYYNLLTWLWII